jgi:hypothetical protein
MRKTNSDNPANLALLVISVCLIQIARGIELQENPINLVNPVKKLRGLGGLA